MKYMFIWNNKNSDYMGLWITKMPEPTRAPERFETVDIPGRAGSLILLEGDDVYENYTKDVIVQTVRTNPRMEEIMEWLRGSGDLILSNEENFSYHARIAAKVQFDKVNNVLMQATITFLVEPFKRSREPASDRISVASSGTVINNPGTVPSKPIVSVTGSSSISINGKTIPVVNDSGTVVIDCDAHVATKAGEIFNDIDEFWTLPVGDCTITYTGTPTIVIDPNWRWV